MSGSVLKLQRALLKAQKLVLDWTGRSGQTYFHHRVAEYREMWRRVADAAGGRFTELGDEFWQIDVDGVTTRIQNHQLEFDNPVVLGLAGNKAVIHRLLASENLAIPEYAVFTLAELDRAVAFVERHPRGCVVKPVNGYGGQGVTTHVQNAKDLRRAALLASIYDRNLMIEVQVPGECYRLLIVEGRMVHAVCRRGPRVRGNGTSTVRQLLDDLNAARRREDRPVLDVDRDCLFTLGYQGLSLESVPPSGVQVLVKSVNDPARKYAEVRTVYTETVTDRVSPSVRQDAERAARIVGSDFLGVDVITTDISVPLGSSGGVINEVNTTPALHHHYDAATEPFPPVALQALNAICRRKAAATTLAR